MKREARRSLWIGVALGALAYLGVTSGCENPCGLKPFELGRYVMSRWHGGMPEEVPIDPEGAVLELHEEDLVTIEYTADDGFTYRVTYDVVDRRRVPPHKRP